MFYQFFIPLKKIPSVTAQQKRFAKQGNRVVAYDSEKLADTRNLFESHLAQHRPPQKMRGALRLCTRWIYPIKDNMPDGEYKITRPDTDNMIKAFKDAMGKVGFFHDDAQVASEVTEKLFGKTSGIWVRVEELWFDD